MPAAEYARFVHKGAWEDRWLTLDYAYHTWLPKSGYGLGDPLEVDCHIRHTGNLGEEADWEILIPVERTRPETSHRAPK
jgi:predicted transcriptional regulator YdeE